MNAREPIVTSEVSMRRREFVALFGGVLMVQPRSVRAQQATGTRRVGVLSGAPENDHEIMVMMIEPFQQGLKKLGWDVDRNLYIDYGWEAIGERSIPRAAELQTLF